MKPGCERFEEMILHYRWLDETERAAVAEHVRQCVPCRETLFACREVTAMFAGVDYTAPAGFASGVAAAVRARAEAAAAIPVIPVLLLIAAVEITVTVALDTGWGEFWTAGMGLAGEAYAQWFAGLPSAVVGVALNSVSSAWEWVHVPAGIDWTLTAGVAGLLVAVAFLAV
jgi:hypothetical protein